MKTETFYSYGIGIGVWICFIFGKKQVQIILKIK